MARTMDQTQALLNHVLSSGPTCVIVLQPPAYTREDTNYIVSATKHLQLPDRAWKPLPLATRLGIDILYAKPENSQHPLFMAGGNTNPTLAALTMDCNPSSTSFGKSGRTATGGVAFKFADKNQNITRGVLQPLEMFINERLSVIKAKSVGPDGVSAAAEEYARMGPQAFKVFFEKYRAEQIERHPGLGWEEVDCPITVAGP